MKFLPDPVETEVVTNLIEIKNVLIDVFDKLDKVKSNGFLYVRNQLGGIKDMSLTEVESFIAGSDKELVSTIVKNGTKLHKVLENDFSYPKKKAIAKQESTKLELYKAMNNFKENEVDSEYYKVILSVYKDGQTLLLNNQLKPMLVIALVDYVFEHVLYSKYNSGKLEQQNYILKRFAGLTILKKDQQLLDEINACFGTDYKIHFQNTETPDVNVKVLNTYRLNGDNLEQVSELQFKNVEFVNWESAFAGTNISSQYLVNLHNLWLLKDKSNNIYIVDKKSKLIPVGLTSYSVRYVDDKIKDKDNNINYDKLLECVMKNILQKKEFLKQYSFFEIGDSVGMFETMSVSSSGLINCVTYELFVDKSGDLVLSDQVYNFDVSKISEFKPASDLKITLFLTRCEMYARRTMGWNIRNEMRRY